jgi:alkanesulfonate monooxygenase SsuD/methylene tetrahydromethanopterin reductase-like flavin-dependent oxidoreductase (luciferase family)
MTKLGLIFPGADLGADVHGIRDYVQAAEDLGYSHLIAYDHVLGAVHEGRDLPVMVPYDETTFFHEPMTLLGFLCAVTSSIELATGVLVLPQRQTALVAKQAAELAILSGGRLRLGVGVGWNHVEYECLGEDFSTRGARQEEQVAVLRRRPGTGRPGSPTASSARCWDRKDPTAIRRRRLSTFAASSWQRDATRARSGST